MDVKLAIWKFLMTFDTRLEGKRFLPVKTKAAVTGDADKKKPASVRAGRSQRK